MHINNGKICNETKAHDGINRQTRGELKNATTQSGTHTDERTDQVEMSLK